MYSFLFVNGLSNLNVIYIIFYSNLSPGPVCGHILHNKNLMRITKLEWLNHDKQSLALLNNIADKKKKKEP